MFISIDYWRVAYIISVPAEVCLLRVDERLATRLPCPWFPLLAFARRPNFYYHRLDFLSCVATADRSSEAIIVLEHVQGRRGGASRDD